MRKETRFKFNAYMSRVAELNGVSTDDVAKKFTVEPSVTQTLMNTLQVSSAFLTKINIVPVDELKGEKVGVGVNGTIASTADTAGDDERKTADFTALESNKYECAQINFDFHIRYKQLDLWARFQDFQTRIRDAIIKRQSLDFIMAGFNGIERAETSNRKTHPMLQDVAVGWLQKYRTEAPARVMSKITDANGDVVSAVIRVGENGDYANLDALVMDATTNLIDEIYQDDPELVVITGRKLLADKYFPIVNKTQPNTESLAADIIISQKRIGNLPAVRVPYFPADALMITLKAIAIPHIDQTQESDTAFLSRLAERNGASVSVKAGKLLFLKAGRGMTASGKPIPQMTVERGDGDRHQFAIADREAYTGVTAKWLHTRDPKPQKQKVKLKRKPKEKHLRALQHPKAAKATTKAKAKKEQEAREGEYMAGEADNVLELTTIYATKAQAMRAAQAKWDKIQRGVAEFSISLAIGRADLFPETPVAVKGFKRVIDEQAWIISRVVHSLNGNGYTTGLELEVKVSDVEYESEETDS